MKILRFPLFMSIESDKKWRLKKEIDIISLLALFGLVITCLTYAFKLEERISVGEKSNTLSVEHLNKTLAKMDERHSQDYSRNTQQFEKLDSKLDDAIVLFLTSTKAGK